uniref:Putative glycosyltransferase family 15 protein n=1 Tax=Moniliophthora roreri TaxID=221103 RepID=A0A0W0FIW4_MONRR
MDILDQCALQGVLHFTLTAIRRDYEGRMFSWNRFEDYDSVAGTKAEPNRNNTDEATRNPRLANATFVILARNTELDGVVQSIRAIEDRFNAGRYPYVLLNDQPFTETFKRHVPAASWWQYKFGLIPKDHWNQPDWIDEEKASKGREQMKAMNVKYGDSVPYRNMCRFNSGFFFKHPLLQKYKWYWRIEPSVKFHCNIKDDPFLFMEKNDKVYGFTMTVYEIPGSIQFINDHSEYIAKNNSMPFLSRNKGLTYSTCHFWSNFEIADMDFWRGEAYSAFFNHLDKTGGFYYERWGDAPVHSIAAGLLLRHDQIHFFEDIGYQHDDWSHCPLKDEIWERGRCSCDQSSSFDYDQSSCKQHWDRMMEQR